MDRSITPALCAFLVTSALHAQPAFHWKLDESNGAVAHEVNDLSNGTLQGGATWAPSGGHFHGACRFDGVDDRVILGPCDLTTGNGEISISLWVKPDLVSAMERTIISKTVGPSAQDHIWSIAFINASALRFRLRTGSITTELSTPASSIFSGAWYHVAATYDGSSMRIHLNGALMAESAANGAMGFHPQAPASLAAQSNGTHPFSGWLDDVRIYPRGLSQAEVIDILLEPGLSTSLAGAPNEAPRVDAGGRLLLPAGDWQEMVVHDAVGRILVQHRIDRTTGPLSGPVEHHGLLFISLVGGGARATWPLVMP